MNLLLEKGATVRRVARGDGFTPGDFIVAGARARESQQTGVDFALQRPPGYEIRKPRIAMYQRYGGGNMDEGWTRLMFEQFNVPFKSIMDAEIKGGGLERQVRRDRAARRFDAGDDRRAPGSAARGAGAGDAAAAAEPTTRRPSIAAASAPKA